jgi:hypothetical protein
MLKLQPNPTFRAAAQISIPGEASPARVEVEFRHLGREALTTYFQGLEGRSDLDALADIVVGWSGVDAAFSREALAALLDAYPTAALALFEAFRRECLEAKAKN